MDRKNTSIVAASTENDRLFVDANDAWDKGDLKRAFTLFMRAARLGDRASQVDLGYFFDNGLYKKKDKKKAITWYRRAYLQGDAGAANNIGTVHRDLGNTRKMLWWFRRAAAMGDPDVLLDLAKRYESGIEVPRNLAKAKVFYRRIMRSRYATNEGKAEAKSRLASLRESDRAKGNLGG
jgi:TPR repeat protein